MIKENIFNLILIALGTKLTFFDNGDAKKEIDFQNKAFGFKFNERDIRINRIGGAVFGIALILVGSLSLLDIINIWNQPGKPAFGTHYDNNFNGIFGIIVGIILMAGPQNERYTMHRNGKPLVVKIGRFKVGYFRIVSVIFGVSAIVFGVMDILK
jgi:hypothetical protein